MFRMIGQITLFPFDFEVSGWMFCDGRQLDIGNNDLLFSLIGTTFGGDGETTFAVPDLRATAPKGCNYSISLTGVYMENYYQGVVGETILTVIPKNPQNMVECAGQSLSTSQYRLLQTYMGTRFGGDANNFKLPDLRAKAPDKYRYMMVAAGSDPNFPSSDSAYVGEPLLLPFDARFEGLHLCDGTLLPAAQNMALSRLLGNRFGGDSQHFALPDLRAAAPPKFNYYIFPKGIFPPRG